MLIQNEAMIVTVIIASKLNKGNV